MSLEKKEIIDALSVSVKTLKQGIDTQCGLLASLKGEGADSTGTQSSIGLCPNRAREKAYKAAIEDAIEIIEESRKAFKSKQLEGLRKKLTRVLIETR